jgi:hypothetical protein
MVTSQHTGSLAISAGNNEHSVLTILLPNIYVVCWLVCGRFGFITPGGWNLWRFPYLTRSRKLVLETMLPLGSSASGVSRFEESTHGRWNRPKAGPTALRCRPLVGYQMAWRYQKHLGSAMLSNSLLWILFAVLAAEQLVSQTQITLRRRHVLRLTVIGNADKMDEITRQL